MYSPSLLSKPIPIAPLSGFRFLFGALVLFSTLRFWSLGWIEDQYLEPVYHFTYFGFKWVQVYHPIYIYALFFVLALSAFLVMVGLFYRLSIILLFLSFSYIELLDKAYYLNHYYFVSVVAFMLIWLPANANHSLDARFGRVRKSMVVPLWTLLSLQCMIGIVYVSAGIAKMQAEWLFDAMPLRIWLPAKDHLPILGAILKQPWAAYVFSWSGMLFDTTIVFFLWWKRTRPLAYVTVVVFHSLTGLLFQIGVFPVVMIALTTVFFSPDAWARFLSFASTPVQNPYAYQMVQRMNRSLPIIALILLLQLVVPFRPLLYPGNMFWTEEGYRFGWHVMLAEKAGTATFYVKQQASSVEQVVDNSDFLNRHQEKQMAFQPDMILQFAHFLKTHYQQEYAMNDLQIRCEAYVSWNARPSKLLIDPQVDLTTVSRGWAAKDWITSAPQ